MTCNCSIEFSELFQPFGRFFFNFFVLPINYSLVSPTLERVSGEDDDVDDVAAAWNGISSPPTRQNSLPFLKSTKAFWRLSKWPKFQLKMFKKFWPKIIFRVSIFDLPMAYLSFCLLFNAQNFKFSSKYFKHWNFEND